MQWWARRAETPAGDSAALGRITGSTPGRAEPAQWANTAQRPGFEAKNVQKHRTHIFTYWHRVSWQLSRWGRWGSRPNWTWQQCRIHSYLWWPSYSWSAAGWCSAHTHVVTRCLSCGWNLRGGGESKVEGGIQVGGGPGRPGERRSLSLAPSPHPKGKGPSDSWVLALWLKWEASERHISQEIINT